MGVTHSWRALLHPPLPSAHPSSALRAGIPLAAWAEAAAEAAVAAEHQSSGVSQATPSLTLATRCGSSVEAELQARLRLDSTFSRARTPPHR